MKTLLHEVRRELYLATKAQVEVFQTFYLVEVYPELWLRDKDVLCILPRTCLTPYIEETTERAQPFCEVYSPHTGELKVMHLLFAIETNCTRDSLVERRE